MIDLEQIYDAPDSSGYGSHIPALKFIFSHIEVDHAVEMGMGNFSTPFLLSHVGRTLISIEMQERSWFQKTVQRFARDYKDVRWMPLLILEQTAYEALGLTDTAFHGIGFAMSDGHGSSRPQAVNYFMQAGVKTIVGHDTESTWYRWHEVEAEKYGYFAYQFKGIAPYTTVWTKHQELINALLELP